VKYVAIAFACACAPMPPHRPITNCSQPAPKEPGHEYYGRWWNVARLHELVIGESTEEDAKCALGRPMTQRLLGGDFVVTWNYSDRAPGQTNPKVDVISISFYSDGVMKAIVGRSSSLR